MPISQEQFEKWLTSIEKEHLEFKEAKQSFEKERLLKYCIAIANERGGHLILGITDNIPRTVVGTNVFQNIASLKQDILDEIHLRIEISEFNYEGKRAIIFEIPSRPIGKPLHYKGAYFMRVGDSLVPMTSEELQKIFDESRPDFSAEICHKASLTDLSEMAIDIFKMLWSKKSNDLQILQLSKEQLLTDSELLVDGKLNYAALILLGTKEALGKHLPNSEIVFEYRNSENSIESQQREDYRSGFLNFHNKLWEMINLRNEIQHVQDELFIRDVPNFNEEVIREALLNAVCHRDYNLQGSVFVRQYPKLLEIESPGGFPAGITPENIIYKQYPRNRRIAEVFQKCGLVERFGQGADKMFRRSIEEAKPKPDFSKSDDFGVVLRIKGEIQDLQFLKFFEKIALEKKIQWSIQDLLILDEIRQGLNPLLEHQVALYKLESQGIIEKFGRGRGVKYILSKRFYTYLGEGGIYTRRKGLDKEEKKALIVKHLENHLKGSIREFEQVLPSLTRNQIHKLLKELKREAKVEYIGPKKLGYWKIK